MKRLRFLIWSLFVCITEELEPPSCNSVNPNADPQCIAENCSCTLCAYQEGHWVQHQSAYTGGKWD